MFLIAQSEHYRLASGAFMKACGTVRRQGINKEIDLWECFFEDYSLFWFWPCSLCLLVPHNMQAAPHPHATLIGYSTVLFSLK